MVFKGFQLTAILKLANAMVFADDKVTPEEMVVCASEFSRFGVSDDQFKKMLKDSDAMLPGDALGIVASLTPAQKKHVCGYLAAIMVVDGVDDKELALWRFISKISQLPIMSIQDAVESWRK